MSVYFFRDPIINLIGLGQSPTSVDTSSKGSESPFSNLASGGQSGDYSTMYTPEVESGLDPAFLTFSNVLRFEDDWDQILEEGQSVVKVLGSQDDGYV